MHTHYVIFSTEHARRVLQTFHEPFYGHVTEMLQHGSPVLVTLDGEGKRRRYSIEPIANAGDCDTGAREAQLDAQIARDQRTA